MQENRVQTNSDASNQGVQGLGAKAQEAPVNDLKSKILSSLSPIEVPNLIHSELKSSEKLGFDHINRKYFTTDLDGVNVKDQMLTVQE